MANKIFGIPILAYFDDLVALIPERIAYNAIDTLREFSKLIGYLLKDRKTDIGREVAPLGLLGKFHIP